MRGSLTLGTGVEVGVSWEGRELSSRLWEDGESTGYGLSNSTKSLAVASK